MAWKNKSDVVLTLMCSLYSAQFGREVDEKGRKLLRGKEKDERVNHLKRQLINCEAHW